MDLTPLRDIEEEKLPIVTSESKPQKSEMPKVFSLYTLLSVNSKRKVKQKKKRNPHIEGSDVGWEIATILTQILSVLRSKV